MHDAGPAMFRIGGLVAAIFGRVLMTSGHGDKVLVVLDYSEKDTYLTACLEHDHFKSKFVGSKRATRGCKK